MKNMANLIPSLHITWMWPYNYYKTHCITNKISSNDSSHCLYISDKKDKFSINFFGDAESAAGHSIIYDYSKLTNEFVFKPSHHGRNSGNIKVRCAPAMNMHDFFVKSAKVKLFISSTKMNKHLSSIAISNLRTESAKTAQIVHFSSSGSSVTAV